METRSFAITSAAEFFKELAVQYEEFRADTLSSRLAINCALWSWHLCEWVYAERADVLPSLPEFRKSLFAACPSLQVMRDIADGSKHLSLDRTTHVRSSRLRRGAFSNDFSPDFDLSELIVTLADGSEAYFEDELAEVMKMWSESPYLKV